MKQLTGRFALNEYIHLKYLEPVGKYFENEVQEKPFRLRSESPEFGVLTIHELGFKFFYGWISKN